METTATTAAVSERVPAEQIMELVFGRWRSQILYAGVRLGVFDALDEVEPRDLAVVAGRLNLDDSLLYRLARALGSLGLLRELPGRTFRLTPAGAAGRRPARRWRARRHTWCRAPRSRTSRSCSTST
jgi:hypothetical protein